VGSAVGSFVGGYLYDRVGDYTMAFHSAALVAFAATVMVLAIRDRPLTGRPPTPAVAVPAGGS
jgi:predicted MFS family arabinose efflux permease